MVKYIIANRDRFSIAESLSGVNVRQGRRDHLLALDEMHERFAVWPVKMLVRWRATKLLVRRVASNLEFLIRDSTALEEALGLDSGPPDERRRGKTAAQILAAAAAMRATASTSIAGSRHARLRQHWIKGLARMYDPNLERIAPLYSADPKRLRPAPAGNDGEHVTRPRDAASARTGSRTEHRGHAQGVAGDDSVPIGPITSPAVASADRTTSANAGQRPRRVTAKSTGDIVIPGCGRYDDSSNDELIDARRKSKERRAGKTSGPQPMSL